MKELAVAQLNELIASRDAPLIIDVRESEEYAAGHIPDALSIPVGSLEHAADESSIACNDELLRARGASIVLYCDTGRRSRGAVAQLMRLGFSDVYWLVGGLERWQVEGFPLSED